MRAKLALLLAIALMVLNGCRASVSQSTNANTVTGEVVGVSDGDTITVLDATKTQHKIRFLGIDAPEKSQAFGQVAKKNLSDMIFGKSVVVARDEA